MEKNIEETEPETNTEGETTPEDGEEKSPEEMSDLVKKAEVSSQNYERAKKAEKELKELKKAQESLSDDAPYEVEATKGDLKTLEARLKASEERETRRELESRHPVLQDKKEDFDEFLEDDAYASLPIDKAATLFMAERGLLNSSPERKGLEKATGGATTPPTSGLTQDDLKRLREEEPRKYIKMIQDGKINLDKIKD